MISCFQQQFVYSYYVFPTKFILLLFSSSIIDKSIPTFGNVSLKIQITKIRSARAKIVAKPAGYINQFPVLDLAQTAKIAPINGPTINPMEKAIPTNV